ncbi:MAG: hypothetical protein H7301_09255 [Cryobacterium sp.]|nr:hypothetical protein [Oligoflexia bacterium]
MSDFRLNRSRVLGTSILATLALLSQAFLLSSAYAVPSNIEAWRDDQHGIIVYKDEDPDSGTYWFIPKIRFEAVNGKTLLRKTELSNGNTEVLVRIIPYFSDAFRQLAARNISNIRQLSQLKPVIAKNIGITLPDFSYKFSSSNVTNFQYLDAPRLLKFSLTPDELTTFDLLYGDASGINVDFSIAYDGVITDKFYNIAISCKSVADQLGYGTGPGSGVGVNAKVKGVGVYLGADVESAFIRTVSNSTKGVDVVSKGDTAGMAKMLTQVMQLCFEPIKSADDDRYGSYYDDRYRNDDDPYGDKKNTQDDYDPFKTHTGDVLPGKDGVKPGDSDLGTDGKGGVDPSTGVDDSGYPKDRSGKGSSAGSNEPGFMNRMSSSVTGAYKIQAEKEALALDRIYQTLDMSRSMNELMDQTNPGRDRSDDGDVAGGGLLPAAAAKLHWKIKKISVNSKNQAVVKNVTLKDSTATVVIPGYLSEKSKAVEKVTITSLGEKKYFVKSTNNSALPLQTKIFVKTGEQWSINAAFVFKAKSGYSPWETKQYIWDSSWDKADGDLYFRVGNGHWTPVNGRSIIESGVIAGGELQFYLDRSSIFNKIPEDLRTSHWYSLRGPMYSLDGLAPEFLVQISGRRMQLK